MTTELIKISTDTAGFKLVPVIDGLFLVSEIAEKAKKAMIPGKIYDSDVFVRELAGILRANGFRTGVFNLFSILRRDGWLCDRKGMEWNTPTSKSMELELFKSNAPGRPPRVTHKGQRFFVNHYALNKKGKLS